MANLVDTSVNGDLRVTGTMFGTQAGNYATCATAAGTAAKAVTISGFTLTTGIHVYVKFTVTNTAAVASLTLNVSGTGAKPIKCRGGNSLGTADSIAANGIYEFAYDGTNWEMVGSAVMGIKGANEDSYRWGNVNITAENVGAAASSHTHGNIANGGTLTDTAAAAAGNDYVVIRDADNAKIQTSTIKGTDVADAVSKKHSHSTLTLSTTAQAYDGTHTLALPSSDPYTSARTPTSHSHGNIANGGTLTDTAAAAAGNDYVVIRDADNAKIQTSTIKGTDVADAVSKKHSHSTLTLSTTAQAYDGTHTMALPSSDPYTSARTPSSHTHGNITNGGAITDTAVALASGDSLAFVDSSDSSKIKKTSITFDGSTATKALTQKGTWETFNNYSHPAGSAPSKTGVPTANSTPGFGGTFKVNQITTDSTSHVSAVTERTITIPNATATTSTAGLMSASDYNRLNGSQNIGEHDADACTTTGFYYGSSNMPSTSLGWTERSGGNDGALFVQACSTSWVGQIGQDYRTGNLFVRGKNNGTYTDWKRIPYLTVKNRGGTTTPVYVDTNGEIQSCTTYAGGTVVTLNNSSKAGSTASFYAPTAGGTANYVLIGAGTTSTPTWTEKAPKAVVTDYPAGFSSRQTSWTWGTLTTANGYTQVTDWHTSNGSDISFAEKSGAVSVQIDGKFYQNDGKNKVIDSADVSVPSTVPTLAWNTESTLATIDGKNIKVKLPASPDTDVKVTQTADDVSTGTGFELLFSATGDNTTRTEASRKSSKLTYQPSTGTIKSTAYNVNSKCTLQFNTTTNALDFVFA